jgi:hypothetical protein
MTDYRKTTEARPWAASLNLGDKLTSQQARCVCDAALHVFGYRLEQSGYPPERIYYRVVKERAV